MNLKWLMISSFIIFIYLIVVNSLLFPFVFPEGLAEKFSNMRPEQVPVFHLLAFVATAVLLTILVDKLNGNVRPIVNATISAALLGLLVALPEHLHLYAMVDATAVQQFMPVVWIIVSWGLAGTIIGAVRGKVSRNNN